MASLKVLLTVLSLSVFTRPLLAQTLSPAPIPAGIVSAKTAFVSNAGAAANEVAERAYACFYASLKQWNRYALTDQPASADLVLELEYIGPLPEPSSVGGPHFQLRIIDRATRTLLWSVNEYPFGTRTDKFEQTNDNAVKHFVIDLQALYAGQYPTAAAAAATQKR